jgi:uncharacterized cupin superfamily protein
LSDESPVILLQLATAENIRFGKHQGMILLSANGKMTQLAAAGPEIEVVSQPDKDFLEKKGVFSWGTWGCGASKVTWSYDSNESCCARQIAVTAPTDDREAATFIG